MVIYAIRTFLKLTFSQQMYDILFFNLMLLYLREGTETEQSVSSTATI